MKILGSVEYDGWFESLRQAEQKLISPRLYRIEEYGHFGDVKNLGEGLAELRWKNGIRVYFCKTDEGNMLLVLGGYKNGQKKDIKKARLLVRRYACNQAG